MRRSEFIKICSDRKFWQWIRTKCPVSYGRLPDKEAFLRALLSKIANRTYYPSPPKEYLTLNKGHGVLRIIPVLQLEDLCIFYYCTRKLEKYIAINHVPGTYGGFGLSGKLRRVEEEELETIKDSVEIVQFGDKSYVFDELDGYPTLSSLNPKAWYAEWNDFTKKLYFNSARFTKGHAAELDISNFYDSIQLDNLEFKLRKYVSHQDNDVVYLLLHFLRFWNRHVNFYRQQGAGIPQDVFGECSRILANFYLQSYDKKVSQYCSKRGAKFFRYADDQIIYAPSKRDLEEIVAKASSLLMREGLNFNQKKVKIMSIEEFKHYYCFENFLKLAEKTTAPIKLQVLRKQIHYYLTNRDDLRKRGSSLLKRILNILSKLKRRPANFRLLKRHLLSRELLLETPLQTDDFKRVYLLLTKTEKQTMLRRLDDSVSGCMYSDRLYNLKMFYVSAKYSTRNVRSRIRQLKKFYELET